MTMPASIAMTVRSGGFFLGKIDVTSPAAARDKTRRTGFIDVAAADPRRRPGVNIRSDDSRPPVITTSARHQKAFQRLSVRYSSDFRKNTGKSDNRSAAQMPTNDE